MYLIFTKNFTKGYNKCMKYLLGIIGHPKELEIKKRVKVIDFFVKYGLAATKEAFGVGRATIYLWKKKLKDSKKVLNAGIKDKTEKLLQIIKENPYQNPPQYEKLVGDLSGALSRRINIQHRLVYQVLEKEKTIKVIRMWTHYE